MAQMNALTEYQLSCLQHLKYPLNLIPDVAKTYQWTLQEYGDRLSEMKEKLCLTYETDVEVPIRDVYYDTSKGNG